MNMSKERQELPTIDYEIDLRQADENYEQAIEILQLKNQMLENALHTAETLIKEYKRDNDELRYKNKNLEQIVQQLNEQIESLKQVVLHHEDENIQIESQISTYIRRNLVAQKKIHQLSQQLSKYHQNLSSHKKNKKQAFKAKLQNFFSFPNIQNNRKSISVEQGLSEQIKSLKKTLRQKDQEIITILRRNKKNQQNLVKMLVKTQKLNLQQR